jgi:hypothetical protein
MSAFGVKQTLCRGLAVFARFRLGCHPPLRSHRPHASPVRIGAVATSGYDFREGQPFGRTATTGSRPIAGRPRRDLRSTPNPRAAGVWARKRQPLQDFHEIGELLVVGKCFRRHRGSPRPRVNQRRRSASVNVEATGAFFGTGGDICSGQGEAALACYPSATQALLGVATVTIHVDEIGITCVLKRKFS